MSDYEVVCLGLLWVSSIWAGLITIFVEHAWPLILLFRFGLDSNDSNWRLNVSPDGTRFAALPSGTGPIHIYSLDGEILQTVRLKTGATCKVRFGLPTERACSLRTSGAGR